MEVVASRYAESLFDLALEENKVELYKQDVEVLYQVFLKNPSFVEFFSHILISEQDKHQMIDKVFVDQVSGYVVNFVKLLIKKKRIKYIVMICASFKSLCNDYLGIEEGIIYSAFDLSNDQIKEIEDVMSKKENKKILLSSIKDESLIGGIKIQLKNQIIDSSIQNKLQTLKKELVGK